MVIGMLMISGGLTAVLSPADFIMPASGPDPVNDVGREFPERVFKARATVTGYITIVTGIAVGALGLFMKELKAPEPHDNSA